MVGHDERPRPRAALLAIAGALLVSCSSSASHRFTMNEAFFLHQADSLVPSGSGCISFFLPTDGVGPSSSAGSADNTGDFRVDEGVQGDAYVVQVFSGQALLASRRYDEAMLASGRVDEFDVTTGQGAVYTLRYWGSATCALFADAAAE